MTWIVLGAVIFLAWSNGANDNIKGVATLYGSGTASYRKSLAWATATTAAGSLLALLLASGLINTFSAKGLVPEALAASPQFLGAVALGAAATVLGATRLGLPISTTHAITGALVGAGLAAQAAVQFSQLGSKFFLPLLVSPLLAVAMAGTLYPIARRARKALGVERTSCVCIDEEWVPVGDSTAAARVTVTAGQKCQERYQGRIAGVTAQQALDGLHFTSAGAVSFARGLNDAPKILALALAAKAVAPPVGLVVVAAAMAIGGIVGARRVAETMSKKIVPLNAGQGFVANLTTAALVLGASRLGVPVSTTHVSNGGLFGIGLSTGEANRKTVATILLAWLTTLPLGAALAFLSYRFS